MFLKRGTKLPGAFWPSVQEGKGQFYHYEHQVGSMLEL